MNRPVQILILSDHPQQCIRWTRFLTSPETSLWQGVSELPADMLIDIVVSDQPLGDDNLTTGNLGCRLVHGEIGVVGIGQKHAADVCLPADTTARELRLACRLLADTVRLRRECNRSRRMQQALNQMAMTDSLTGLPNRRAWDDELLERDVSATNTLPVRCIALLDLDHFKAVNDTLGHVAGDHLLRLIAQSIPPQITSDDFAARWGGDEFALILQAASSAELVERVEAIRRSVRDAKPGGVTASAGFSIAERSDKVGCCALLHAADVALRKAKSAGRNRSLRENPSQVERDAATSCQAESVSKAATEDRRLD